MNKLQQQVLDFHFEFGLTIHARPTLVPADDELRLKLIAEEKSELAFALLTKDVVKVADALGDLLYVVYGAAVTYGIDMEPICDEIHRSNMTKVGGHKREDGKWMKPATYEPPRLEGILKGQGWKG